MRWAFLFLLATCPATAGQVSPPLSVAGASAALAQAGVRENVSFSIGPYRYQVARIKTTSAGKNAFALVIVLKPLPMGD